MISHRARCIFVRIPKCAGTSVSTWLRSRAQARPTNAPWWWGGELAERAPARAEALETFPDYFTFAFMRDPQARFVSLYRNACRRAEQRPPGGRLTPGTMNEFAELVEALLEAGRGKWGRRAREWFANEASRRFGPHAAKLEHLGWLHFHAQPQAHFLPDLNPEYLLGRRRERACPLDFIGRVERIEEDLGRVAARLGIGLDGIPAENRAPETGTTPSANVELPAAAAERLRTIYEADFAFLEALARVPDPRAEHTAPHPGTSAPGDWRRRMRWHAREAAWHTGVVLRRTAIGRVLGQTARRLVRGAAR